VPASDSLPVCLSASRRLFILFLALTTLVGTLQVHPARFGGEVSELKPYLVEIAVLWVAF
jgi:hypothetical protein